MVIDNKLSCVIYTLIVTKYDDSIIPEELIYNFLLCKKSNDDYYFYYIPNNEYFKNINDIFIDKAESISEVLQNISLATRIINPGAIDLTRTSSELYVFAKEFNKRIYTLNDLLTIGDSIDLDKYRYKIKKNIKPVTLNIEIDYSPININLLGEKNE